MFTVDSRTENFLTQIGVQYAYKNGILLPDHFTQDWDKHNIGRPVPVREDAVLEYATLMESGSAAPAPILHYTDAGYIVLDGVQRLSAAVLQQITRISAYVIQTDSADSLATIRVLANARMQGRAEAAEWTRRRAIEVLVIGRGMSCSEVAKMGGWKSADVKRIADAIELQERVSAIGGPELSDAMLSVVRQHMRESAVIEKASGPVAGFLNTLKQAKMSASDAEEYVTRFFAPVHKAANLHKTLTERLEDIHEDAEIRTRITGRQSTETPKDVVLLKTLKSADTVLDGILAHGEKVANVDEFFRIIDRITKKLRTLAPNKKAESARVPADMWSDKR